MSLNSRITLPLPISLLAKRPLPWGHGLTATSPRMARPNSSLPGTKRLISKRPTPRAMTTAAPRSYVRLGAAIVIAAVVIGAGIFASTLFGTPASTTRSVATAPTTATSCSPTGDLAAPRHFAFNVAVNYTGRWNATAEGYSGTTPAFIDCYTGNGLGFIYLSDWNQGGRATLQVVAEKADLGNGNLTIKVSFGASSFMTEANGTLLPRGSATITATMLGEAAVVSNFTLTTSVGGARLYDVTFHQSGACSPLVYVAPWSVTLGNETVAEPSNATLPISGGYVAGPEYQSLSTIAFSVPDGVYQYALSPQGAFAQPKGSVTVNGSDVSVELSGPAVTCTISH